MKILRFISIVYLVTLLAASVGISWLAPEGEWRTQIEMALQAPSFFHWFGTDSLGRDLLIRGLYASRVTLLLGFFCCGIAMLVGVTYGSVAAWWGGWSEQVLMRSLEVFMALPQMVTIGIFILVLGAVWPQLSGWPSLFKLGLAIGLSTWMTFARLSRNLTLREKSLLYIEAAVAIGASPSRILLRQLLPNITPSLLVMAGLQLPNFLLFESFLSFLGIGIQPPMASWGLLLQEGWSTLSVYPHLLIFPAFLLFGAVFSFNLLFDDFRKSLLRSFAPVDTHH